MDHIEFTVRIRRHGSKVPSGREEAVMNTIAADIAYMLNEKHEDVYCDTSLFVPQEVNL